MHSTVQWSRQTGPCAIIMRTQPPTPPFDVVDVDVARYGSPQHETSTNSCETSTNSVESLYGPPQHETEVEDPEWLISIASKAFSVEAPEPAGAPTVDEQPTEPPERERAVVRL